MKIQRLRKLGLVLSLVWGLTIIVACLWPNLSSPNEELGFEHIDKVVHIVIYFIWSFLICVSFAKKDISQKEIWRFVLLLFAFSLGTGYTIEWLQENISSGRNFDLLDIIANISGSIVGIGTFYFLKRKLFNKWVI